MGFVGRANQNKASLKYDAAKGTYVAGSPVVRLLQFGAGALSASAATRFLYPGNGTTAPTVIRNVPCGAEGVVTRMAIRIDSPTASPIVLTYELYKNGLPTGLSVSGPASSTFLSVSGSIAVASTDYLAIRVTKAAAVSVANVAAVLEIGDS